MKHALATLALGLDLLVAAPACADRLTGADFDERVRAACTAACERRHECVTDPMTASPEACFDDCVASEILQEPDQCADAMVTLLECLGELTCAEHQLRENREDYLDEQTGEFTVAIPCEHAVDLPRSRGHLQQESDTGGTQDGKTQETEIHERAEG